MNNNLFSSFPKNIKFLRDFDINDVYSPLNLDNSISIFKSINNIFYLIYSTEKISIISYNIIQNKKMSQIKKAHKSEIIQLKHYLDKINKRDLLLSLSSFCLKLWNIINFECIFKIKSNTRYIISACMLIDNNQNYIIEKKYLYEYNQEPIHVYDLKGNKINDIKDSMEYCYFIDIYYDIKNSKNYIITGNKGILKSFDFNKNEVYNIYDNKYYGDNNLSVTINQKKDIIQIIGSCTSGYIVIWNFNTGELLKEIKISIALFGICLWNENYLFVGHSNGTIILIDLNNGEEVKVLKGHKNFVIGIKKIYISQYGECLISNGSENDKIKIWVNEK